MQADPKFQLSHGRQIPHDKKVFCIALVLDSTLPQRRVEKMTNPEVLDPVIFRTNYFQCGVGSDRQEGFPCRELCFMGCLQLFIFCFAKKERPDNSKRTTREGQLCLDTRPPLMRSYPNECWNDKTSTSTSCGHRPPQTPPRRQRSAA